MKKIIGGIVVALVIAFLVLPWFLRASGAYAKWAWAPIFGSKAEKTEVVQTAYVPADDQKSSSAPVAAAPVANELPAAAPVASTLDSFPSTTAYTVTMNFKDGTSQTKGYMTDLDLQDDKETWAKIQLVGISDLVVSNTTPLLFFYNGYVFPIDGGQNQSLGEIWQKEMSADVNYDSGFSLRQLANGCTQLSSTWTDANGEAHMQAQTAVNSVLSDWLEQYCDPQEITAWKADRATLGMPESLFTK